jgi:Diacylglycerol kinase accessory domain
MCQMQNYFSVGADAEVARRFDVARSAHPERFRSAFVNKVKYALYGSTLALFGASSLEKRLASLSIDGVDVPIPKGAKSLVCLNIPSFGAGTNPWGEGGVRLPNSDDPPPPSGCVASLAPAHGSRPTSRLFLPPAVDDGLLEVTALFGVIHAANMHNPFSLSKARGYGGKRLGQGKRITFQFHSTESYAAATKGRKDPQSREELSAQVDGEAWAFPWAGEKVDLRLLGRVGVLVGPHHRTPANSASATWPHANITRRELSHGLAERSESLKEHEPSEGVQRDPVVT